MLTPTVFFLSGDRALVRDRRGPFADSLLGLRQVMGDALHLIAAAPGEGTPFELAPGVRVFGLGTSRLGTAAAARHALKTVLDTGEQPVLVHHLHGLDLAARGAWRFCSRVRAWITEVHHLPIANQCFGWRGSMEARVLRRRLRFLAARVSAFRVVEEQETPRQLQALGIAPERIHFVPAVYLDTQFYCPDDALPRDLDLLWVAPWTVEKGRHLCSRVVAALARRYAPAKTLHVAVIGRGVVRGTRTWKRDGISVEAEEHVSPDSLRNFYRRARVLLVTSSAEGGPRVAAEALACGTPLVSTPVGRMSTWIQSAAVGSITDPQTGALVQAIEQTWNHAQHGHALRREVEAELAMCEREQALRAYGHFLRAQWQCGDAP